MHLLMILLIAGLIVALILSLRPRTGHAPAAAVAGLPWARAGGASRRLAFISRGKLFHVAGNGPVREVHSAYVQGVVDRLERSRKLHGWKQGTAFSANFGRGDMEGERASQPIQATSAQFIGPDRLLYFLKDDNVGGLFEQDLADGSERRLVHKQNLALEDLRLSPDRTRLLCSQHAPNGVANVAMMGADGSDYRELTGGDTVDTAPAWIPGDEQHVVFQSAGLARNPQGYAIALGPSSIQMFNLKDGSLTPILEATDIDYLQPRVGPDGTLFFIRRPYEMPNYSTRNALLDALLLPFRLLRALFHYLNFFSLMYSRKPLTGASGPMMQGDLKDILLKGKRFDADEALRRGKLVNGVPSLVPAEWQLMCRMRSGEEHVLASHVSSFDIAADGSLVYSNGCGVFAFDGSAAPPVLLKDQLIVDLVAGEAPSTNAA